MYSSNDGSDFLVIGFIVLFVAIVILMHIGG